MDASQIWGGNSLAGISASGGWNRLPSLGETQGRHEAGTQGDLMGLAGRGLAGHFRLGTCYEYRHPVDEARHGLGGALRGGSPRTREGRIGPTAHNCSGQWSVVSGQRRRSGCLRDGWEVAMVWSRPEVYESSSPFWDAPTKFSLLTKVD